MNDQRRSDLERRALRVREHIIRLATDGGCFIGASLSCTDLLVYLYAELLHIFPFAPRDPGRDYFFLSKGHDVPALYGTFVELGFMPRERLAHHLSTTDAVYWHPNRAIPGVEFHAGSLGHLLAVGIGVALDIKIRGGRNRVFVLLGDGELDEGSVWEACLVAAAHRLDNLVAVVDRNGFQANVRTEELTPLEPLKEKFEAFGWGVTRINGHSFDEMDETFPHLPFREGMPSVIIADTVRGKGLPSIEQRADRWFADFTRDEVGMLLKELRGEGSTTLTSQTLIVR